MDQSGQGALHCALKVHARTEDHWWLGPPLFLLGSSWRVCVCVCVVNQSLSTDARSNKDLEICECLIEAGADVHLKDPILVCLSVTLLVILVAYAHKDVHTDLRGLAKCWCSVVHPLQCLIPLFNWNPAGPIMELIDLFSEHGVDVRDPRTSKCLA
jgi:hypothetical protein